MNNQPTTTELDASKPPSDAADLSAAFCSEYVATMDSELLTNYCKEDSPWRAIMGFVYQYECLEDKLKGDWDIAEKLTSEVEVFDVIYSPKNATEEEEEQFLNDFCWGDAFDSDNLPEWVTGKTVARYEVRWEIRDYEVFVTSVSLLPNVPAHPIRPTQRTSD